MKQRDIDRLNRESERQWTVKYERISAKVGTVPMSVWIDKPTAKGLMDETLVQGDRVTWCEGEWGQQRTGIIAEVRFSTSFGYKALSQLFVDRF